LESFLVSEILTHPLAIRVLIFGVPMSTLSLIDPDQQWNKSRFGLNPRETPQPFCQIHRIFEAF